MRPTTLTQNAYAPPATEGIQMWRSRTAKFTVHWGRSGAVITVRGEIDAANATAFAQHTERLVQRCEWLVIDLSELEFIGIEGFSALQEINTACTNIRAEIKVIPGPALRAVSRICDPYARLPLADSLTEALAEVQQPGRPPLRLVP